jgi:hypothetical protein
MIEPKLGPLGPLVAIGWHDNDSVAGLLWGKVEGPEFKWQLLANNRISNFAPSPLGLVEAYKSVSQPYMTQHLHRHRKNTQASKSVRGQLVQLDFKSP